MRIQVLIYLYIVAFLQMNCIHFLGNNVLFLLFFLLGFYQVYRVLCGFLFTIKVGKIKQLAGTFMSLKEAYRGLAISLQDSWHWVSSLPCWTPKCPIMKMPVLTVSLEVHVPLLDWLFLSFFLSRKCETVTFPSLRKESVDRTTVSCRKLLCTTHPQPQACPSLHQLHQVSILAEPTYFLTHFSTDSYLEEICLKFVC